MAGDPTVATALSPHRVDVNVAGADGVQSAFRHPVPIVGPGHGPGGCNSGDDVGGNCCDVGSTLAYRRQTKGDASGTVSRSSHSQVAACPLLNPAK